MPSKDFIPHDCHLFNDWQNNLINVANSHIESWGLTNLALEEWTLLTMTERKKKKRWEAIWFVVSKKDSKSSEKTELRSARKDYENGNPRNPKDTSLRLFITRYIRDNTKVTTQQKAEMRVTVPIDSQSSASPTTSKNAQKELQGSVTMIKHLYHQSIVKVIGRKSLALGEGVYSIRVFIAFTQATDKTPPSIEKFKLDGTVSLGKYPPTFTEEEECLRAWYYARIVFKGRKKRYVPPANPGTL